MGAKPGSVGSSAYLLNLTLPAQLSLLVADVLVAANFVVALLVPWVEARYRVANVWFPVYVPIKASRWGMCVCVCVCDRTSGCCGCCFFVVCVLHHMCRQRKGGTNRPPNTHHQYHHQIGLLKCFGDVCSMLMGGSEQQGGNSGGAHKHKTDGGGNDSPPPIPGWGPPMPGGTGGGGVDGGGGGGGAKTLFEVSAVFAVILLSASVLCALGSGLLEVRASLWGSSGGWGWAQSIYIDTGIVPSTTTSRNPTPPPKKNSSPACRAATT